MDFWQTVTLIGLGLGATSVAIGGVGVWLSARQTGAITDLIAGAERRTQAILARMETNAEARYRDLKSPEGEDGRDA